MNCPHHEALQIDLNDYWYNVVIADLEDQPVTGGLFFAVCRGKVSEGMDFADNNARAVITVSS